MPPREPIEELASLADNSTAGLAQAVERLARAIHRVDEKARESATRALANLLGETMTLADLLGRRRLMLEAQPAARRLPGPGPQILFAVTPAVPRVPFDEAVQDLLSRWPALADIDSPVPRWEQIAELYKERHAFGLARATDLVLTERIQGILRQGMTRAEPVETTKGLIEELSDFTRAYVDTVYRTNLNTAYTAGRFKQAEEPAVSRVIGAFELVDVGDADVRPNHHAASGLVASQFDPIWEEFSPPLGYNCRCSLRLMDRFELERKGLIGPGGQVKRYTPAGFGAAYPDPGFGRGKRPDRQIYG